MKAKDYLNKYKKIKAEKGSDYAVVKCFMDMFNEIETIQKNRNAKSNSAVIAIFNEMNKKGNAFIKMINKEIDETKEGKIYYDGFKIFIQTQMPDLAKMINWS